MKSKRVFPAEEIIKKENIPALWQSIGSLGELEKGMLGLILEIEIEVEKDTLEHEEFFDRYKFLQDYLDEVWSVLLFHLDKVIYLDEQLKTFFKNHHKNFYKQFKEQNS